jgi:hypothetical protein
VTGSLGPADVFGHDLLIGFMDRAGYINQADFAAYCKVVRQVVSVIHVTHSPHVGFIGIRTR